jgi:sulfur relay (sulfurtransferase) complex TusBCD TusD component (DsrE family)
MLSSVDPEAVEALHVMEEKGVEILSCGTCLEKFGLVNQIQVGRVTNMFEVVESLNASTKVISPD